MDNSNLYNTGTGLSGLDNGYFSQITADQIIVESNLQLPNDLTLPTDLLPLQNNRDALNGLQAGEIVVKGTTNDTYSSIPTSNDFNTTTNDIVRKTSGRINTDTISIGDSTSTLGDANIKKTSGNAELFLISPSSNIPRLYLIRNAGSDTFAGDAASDWTMMNQSGNLVFERGNAFLQNGYLTPFRVTFYNTIELNYYNSGAIVDVCPLRMYRQISGDLNNFYVDIKPSSNVAGQYTQLLPAENGTYITDATSEYVNLNTMYTNINAQTNNNLLIKTGTNTFSSTTNNSVNWDIAYGDSQTNKSDIATMKGVGWVSETIKGNADNISINASNIGNNTSWRSDFDSQTLNNLLYRDGTSTFGNIGIDNGFGAGSLIVKKDSGVIKSQSFLVEQSSNGYMFQSFTNPSVISYLYHSTNSGLGSAVQMPSSSGQLALTSQIEWTKSGTLIQPKTLTDRLALGVSAPPSVARLNFGSDIESKICLYGNNSHMYGFGVSASQLNYHVYSSGDRHCFYSGGTNGNGTELMRIQGDGQTILSGTLETTGGVGIGKAPAVGFALDVDGTNPSIFRGTITYLGQAVYASSFPPKYDFGIDFNSGVFNNTIDTLALTQNRSINFPDADGTVALTNTGGVWTTSSSDIYNSNSGNVGIGITPSLKLTVAPVNSNDSMVIKGHYNNIDTFLGCGGNVPQSGPVYRVF
jgi:hypothetical protein